MTRLYIVVPCYNEQEILQDSAEKLKNKLFSMNEKGLVSDDSKILFVDDGSRDSTWDIITKLYSESSIFEAIRLSKNEGHQNALYAGLMTVKDYCDAAISIDADLQDSLDAMDHFVEKFNDGCDIVYGVRNSRKTDSFLKRFTATSYYKILKFLGCDVVYNHADYRLMSKRALVALSEYKEINLFLRGIVKQIGFKTDCVYYDRLPRQAGESKYTVSKMLRLAGDGITSFSVKPLNFILALSTLASLLGAGLLITSLVFAIMSKAAFAFAISGSIWLALGIQLLVIWIVGKYIGKIYSEVKARPRYIISEKIIGFKSEEKI